MFENESICQELIVSNLLWNSINSKATKAFFHFFLQATIHPRLTPMKKMKSYSVIYGDVRKHEGHTLCHKDKWVL